MELPSGGMIPFTDSESVEVAPVGVWAAEVTLLDCRDDTLTQSHCGHSQFRLQKKSIMYISS